MKKINTYTNQSHPFLLLAAAALLLLTTNAQKTEDSLTAATVPAALSGCNATRIADCLADDDDEFLMESEISRRLLVGRPKTLGYNTLSPERPYCNRDVYGSCNGKLNKIYTKRKCDYENHCGRRP